MNAYLVIVLRGRQVQYQLYPLVPKYTYHNLPIVATYPSAGGRRVTRGMRVPRKENRRSRHQRLFEENIGKTGKGVVYEL